MLIIGVRSQYRELIMNEYQHVYRIFLQEGTYQEAQLQCKNSLYKGNGGFLPSIDFASELSTLMIYLNLTPGLEGKNIWLNGGTNGDSLVFYYNNGWDNGSLLYDFKTETCTRYCKWNSSSPTASSTDVVIYYDQSIGYFNTRSPNDGTKYAYICEYTDLGPSVQPISTNGGEIILDSKSMGLLKFDDGPYQINMTRLSEDSRFPSYLTSSISISPDNTTVKTIINAGSGTWILSLIGQNRIYSTIFQYLSPHISLVYLKTEKDSIVTVIGDNFGVYRNRAQLYFNEVECFVTVLINGYIECSLVSDIGPGVSIYPIKIVIDYFEITQYKVPFFYKDGTFIQCWTGNIGINMLNTITTGYDIFGSSSELSYVDSEQLANLTSIVCNRNTSDISSPSYVYTGLRFDGTYFIENKNNKLVTDVYGSTLNVSPAAIVGYDVVKKQHQYLDMSNQYGFIASLKYPFPKFIQRSFSIPTSGGVYRLDFTMNFTSSGAISRIHYGSSATDFILGQNNSYFYVFPMGYAGPSVLKVSLTSAIGTLVDSIPFSYQPPIIESVIGLSRSSSLITIYGDNFYYDPNQIQVQLIGNVNTNILQCSSINITLAHKTIQCLSPNLSVLDRNITLIVKRYNDFSLPYVYNIKIPKLNSIAPLGRKHQNVTYTITGQYFSNIYLSVTIGGQACTRTDFISDTKLLCQFDGSVYSPAGQPLEVIVSSDGYVDQSYSFYYATPTLETLYPLGIKNQNQTYTITGNNFMDYKNNITIEIGGRECQQLQIISDSSLSFVFGGDVLQNDSKVALYVNLTTEGRISIGKYLFNYNPGLSCNVCINGDCDSQTGSCLCAGGWTGSSCTDPVDNGGEPSQRNGTVINPADKINFTTSITHLREIDSTYSFIKTLDMSTVKWKTDNVENHLIGSFDNDSVILDLQISFYTRETKIYFGGQEIVMPSNSAKYQLKIINWIFKSNLNSLEVIFMSKTDKSAMSGCSIVDTTIVDSSKYSYTIKAGDSLLSAKFASYLYVDNRVTLSKINVLDQDDPIVKENENDNYFLSATSISIPNFEEYSIIDPSFSALISSNSDQDCKNSNSWRIPVIVVVTVVGGLACIITLSLWYRKKIMKKMWNKKIEVKLQSQKTTEE